MEGLSLDSYCSPSAVAAAKARGFLPEYDLIASVAHGGASQRLGKEMYSVHAKHAGSKKWYSMTDLDTAEILPEQVALSETYVLCYEQRRN